MHTTDGPYAYIDTHVAMLPTINGSLSRRACFLKIYFGPEKNMEKRHK